MTVYGFLLAEYCITEWTNLLAFMCNHSKYWIQKINIKFTCKKSTARKIATENLQLTYRATAFSFAALDFWIALCLLCGSLILFCQLINSNLHELMVFLFASLLQPLKAFCSATEGILFSHWRDSEEYCFWSPWLLRYWLFGCWVNVVSLHIGWLAVWNAAYLSGLLMLNCYTFLQCNFIRQIECFDPR